jgi:hypothetical protein
MFALEFVFIHTTATTMILLILVHKVRRFLLQSVSFSKLVLPKRIACGKTIFFSLIQFVHIRKTQQVLTNDVTSIHNASAQITGERVHMTEEQPANIEYEELRVREAVS